MNVRHSARESADGRSPTGQRDAAILIVDDAPDYLAALRTQMAEQGYQTFVANSGERALQLARHVHPDLILMDIVMPDMDGFEACRRLKAHPVTQRIPIIFMSGRTDTEDVVAGLDLGAVDYIGKPLRMAEVCARVRAQLHQQRAAMVDPLTKLANRRHFDSFLEKAWQRAARNGTPLSLVMLDVDHFKLYNDTLGHAAGDICLQQVAQALGAHALRGTDLAARYGGEEFVLLFTDTDLDAAATVAEATRAHIEALQLPHPKSPTSPWITVSLGVATIQPRQHDSTAALFLAADRAMYAAKEGGRNRVSAIRGVHPSSSTSRLPASSCANVSTIA